MYYYSAGGRNIPFNQRPNRLIVDPICDFPIPREQSRLVERNKAAKQAALREIQQLDG